MRHPRGVIVFRLARGAEKELSIAGIPLALALVAALLWPGIGTILIAGVLLGVFVLLLHFFRDPERTPPILEGAFLAPADGEIIEAQEAPELSFLEGDALRISTFMSLLDVHVNRAPAAARVALVRRIPGQFLQAFRPEASEANEHNLIGLESPYGKVLVKQIAGIMARRVVCWALPGQDIEAGDRLGMVKFGSRVDLYLPPEAVPMVRVGDQVRAGETVVAMWKGKAK